MSKKTETNIIATEIVPIVVIEEPTLPGMPEAVLPELTLSQVVDEILESMNGNLEITMYAGHKVVNAALEIFDVHKDGKEYRIIPQMMYNYNRNKLVVKGQTVDRLTKVQLREFVIRFVGKRLDK